MIDKLSHGTYNPDAMKKKDRSTIAINRKARFNYFVEDSLECGIELQGTEVKSVKDSKISFSDSYARIENSELWLIGLHISQYSHGNIHNHNPDRKRRLLAHKKEIKKLKRKIDEKGYALIPVRFYLKNGLVKIELGICKGKKLYDKRNDIKKRDIERDIDRNSKF